MEFQGGVTVEGGDFEVADVVGVREDFDLSDAGCFEALAA